MPLLHASSHQHPLHGVQAADEAHAAALSAQCIFLREKLRVVEVRGWRAALGKVVSRFHGCNVGMAPTLSWEMQAATHLCCQVMTSLSPR